MKTSSEEEDERRLQRDECFAESGLKFINVVLLDLQIFSLARKKHSTIFVHSDLKCPFIKFSINNSFAIETMQTHFGGTIGHLPIEISGATKILLVCFHYFIRLHECQGNSLLETGTISED